jgi:xylan 1,4-beta-xylosidase
MAYSIEIPKGYENKDIALRIDTDYLKRSFWYGFGTKADLLLGTLSDVYYLCDEGYDKGKRFTGAMIGMYAVSGAVEEKAWGEFQYWDKGI